MEGRIPQYPRLSADTVGFTNKLNKSDANKLEFTAGGQLYALQPATATQSPEYLALVWCSINGQRMRFGFDAGICDLLLSDWLPLEELAALPDDLRKSIIAAALNPVVDFFTKHAIGKLNVEDIECQVTSSPPSGLSFNLLSANEVIVGQACTDADHQTIDLLHQIWQAAAGPTPSINTEDLAVSVEVVVASTTLSLQAFRQLAEGDIILLDTAFAELRKVCAKISDNISFSSVIDGNKLIIQKQGRGQNGK